MVVILTMVIRVLGTLPPKLIVSTPSGKKGVCESVRFYTLVYTLLTHSIACHVTGLSIFITMVEVGVNAL